MQVNVTLGGGYKQLLQHVAAVSARFGDASGIDFKLAKNPGVRMHSSTVIG
jgi:hypothetical protein